MNISRPYGVVSHPLDSTVLHVLAGTTQGLTGRGIARLAGEGTQEGVRKALGRLVEEGVVEQQEAGSAILFRLNRRHLATPAIEKLVDLRRELLTRLEKEFAGWRTPPLHASIFGSAARGDGDSSSDIDLFVVRPGGVEAEDRTWVEQIDRLVDDAEAWTGNRVSVAEVSEPGLEDLRRRRPAIVASLEADALTLAGPDAATILASED